MEERKQVIPIVYVRGTHYQCGFEVGRTFSSLIKKFLETSRQLNEYFLPVYDSEDGRKNYEDTLSVVKEKFPQFVDEIRGTADGAQVEFHKLMLFHFDEIIPNVTHQLRSDIESNGCSTVYVKNSHCHILAHTEDAASECLNTFYIVSAHIITDEPFGPLAVKEEKFTSLCYPGHIGGYTMSFNKHNFVFTINTLVAKHLLPHKIPRHFTTRALLAASNYDQAMDILRESNLSDGFSINMTFTNDNLFSNIEMGPAVNGKSQMNEHKIESGYNIHCNHYLRLKIEEQEHYYMNATKARYETLLKFKEPTTKEDIINMLGDTSHDEFYVFRCQPTAATKTICVGIFDLIKRTWSLYKDNPKCNDPIATISLDF